MNVKIIMAYSTVSERNCYEHTLTKQTKLIVAILQQTVDLKSLFLM